jgi:hypothetical protein
MCMCFSVVFLAKFCILVTLKKSQCNLYKGFIFGKNGSNLPDFEDFLFFIFEINSVDNRLEHVAKILQDS